MSTDLVKTYTRILQIFIYAVIFILCVRAIRKMFYTKTMHFAKSIFTLACFSLRSVIMTPLLFITNKFHILFIIELINISIIVYFATGIYYNLKKLCIPQTDFDEPLYAETFFDTDENITSILALLTKIYGKSVVDIHISVNRQIGKITFDASPVSNEMKKLYRKE